jgi:alanine dehydrogenase
MQEIEYMQPKQTLLSTLQLPAQPENFIKKLLDKKITALAFEWIKDEDGVYPVIRSMGEIAGGTSILIAAEYLSNVNNGQGAILGGISGVAPTEVVIIGAGTVGEYAARAALGLGASVKFCLSPAPSSERPERENFHFHHSAPCDRQASSYG